MKQEKMKKLCIGKQTIALLNDEELLKGRGGETGGITCRIACTGDTFCITGCLSQCVICE